MHRNWPAICNVGRNNRPLMIVLASVDPSGPIGEALVQGFPECFSETEVQKRIPMSVLRQEFLQIKQGRWDHSDSDPYHQVLFQHHIPYIGLGHSGPNGQNRTYLRRSAFIDDHSRMGSVISFEDTQWVVLMSDDDMQYTFIVPKECIDMNA